MADDPISGQVKTEKTPSKLDYWIAFGANSFIAALCAVMFFMMPWINSMEDEVSATLSETLAGRWQMVVHDSIGALIIAFILAAISYGFSCAVGVKGGRPLKTNPAFKMALIAYFVWIIFGILGAISFLMSRSPFNVFGF